MDLEAFAVNVTRVSVNILFDLHLTGKLAFPVVQQDMLDVLSAGQGCPNQQKSLLSQHTVTKPILLVYNKNYICPI